jgi:hypothetical protein
MRVEGSTIDPGDPKKAQKQIATVARPDLSTVRVYEDELLPSSLY